MNKLKYKKTGIFWINIKCKNTKTLNFIKKHLIIGIENKIESNIAWNFYKIHAINFDYNNETKIDKIQTILKNFSFFTTILIKDYEKLLTYDINKVNY